MKSKFVKMLLALVLLVGCAPVQVPSGNQGGVGQADILSSLFGAQGTTYTSNWTYGNNCGKLNTNVSSKAKKKRTTILGNNKDVVTIMVYMCGSDLESNGGMASYDLQEMVDATLNENINLIVYTGGARIWKNKLVKNDRNQIYRIHGGGQIECLVDNAGKGAMTDPNTLVSFIEFCEKNFKANRNELILWDHGAGSTGGYGKDENNAKYGSMSLAGLDSALSSAGVYFDFISFDACLMGNTETALMVSEYADYLIASEEAEPGIGWYYTDWLNALGKNTSISTLELGKIIVDSFVSTCKAKTPRQSATLSVIDLAEVKATIPDLLTDFSKSTNELMLKGNEYKTIANARSESREFATQAKVDLVDLVDLANKINTKEGKALADGLLSCIKYNNTTNDMSNSYGMSIYFPYRNKNYVNTVLSTYKTIKMNSEYTKCLTNFVNYATTAQVSSGGSHNAYQSMQGYTQQQSYQQQNSSDALMDLMGAFLGGSMSNQQSQQSSQSDPYAALLNLGLNALLNAATNKTYVDYVVENHFDADLSWVDGKIKLTKDQWSLVDDLRLNVFIDDGEGYIDLGKDNIYDIDEEGNLLAQDELTWMAISVDEENYQIVPYYYLYTFIDENDQEIYHGYIPVLYNDQEANLMIQIDDDGIVVTGLELKDTDGPMVAKELTEFNKGDTFKFVCNYFDYDGNFIDTYQLGDTLVYDEAFFLGDMEIDDYDSFVSYEFVDIYQQSYWSAPQA